MTTRRLVIVGGGEHARVVAEAAGASGWDPIGYTDAVDAHAGDGDRESGEQGVPGLARLGTDASLAAERAGQPVADRAWLVLGFGGPTDARRRAVAAFGPDARWAVIVHPGAWVSPSAELSPGAVILVGAVVNAGATVGPHAIVNSGAIVEHDVRIGLHAHVAPGATIGGGTTIGDAAFIGLGASVRDHVVVAERAMVAMGAVVVGDVRAGALVSGLPAQDSGRGGR